MPLGAYVTPKTNTTKQGDAITHLAALFTLTQWIHSVKSCSRLDYDSYRPQITTVYIKKRAHACMALHPMAQVSACVRASNLVCACIWSMHVCAWYMAVRASTHNSMDPTRWHSPTEHGNPATDHRRQADRGTRGGPQGTRPHCRRHLATHPRGGPPGRGGTCSGPPLPRQRSSPHTAPTNTCNMQQPCPKQTKPTSSNSCSTNHENLPSDIPTRNPHHAYTPSTEHNTGTAHTGTTGTAHTPTSMRAPPAPMPPRHNPSTGTTNRQPPHVPSAYASGYHRRPCPATQTTGSAWEPRTASPTAPTAGTSTPTTASGPRP